jgi:hypothetical protein
MACTILLRELITRICARAGLDESKIDVSQLPAETEVRGLTITNQYPAFTTLRALSEIYLFDPSNYDGKVHFIPRGAASVATITEDDMLDNEQEIDESKRSDSIQIPRVLHLNYFDVTGGLATNKQTSERAGDRRSIGENSLQTPVILNTDEAARAIVINHKVMAEDQKGELKISLPDSFIELVPSDPVVIQWQGRSERARITKVETQDGYQDYVLLRDRQSSYTSLVEGIPPPPSTPPPPSAIGATLIHALDIHILRDSDDAVGLLLYFAASGVSPAWTGATIEVSYDSGANYVRSGEVRLSTIMGTLLDALPDHPADFPDEVNAVRVEIATPDATLESTDLTGLLNRENLALIGDEMIQFASADEYSPGEWDISYFLRGRKGTSAAAHSAGTRFVLLDRDSIAMVPAELTDIGRTLTIRATSFGRTSATGTVINITYQGRSQIERAPAYVTAHRAGSDAVVTWQGVGRLGAGALARHGERFDGYRVTFDDGTNPAIVVETDDTELTQDVSSLSGTITIGVQQLNTLTGAGPATEVTLP